jgi:L-ascorbate metabolism protein UlaG (beta-lactamase superfamily)
MCDVSAGVTTAAGSGVLIDLHLHTSTAPKWTVSPPLRGFSRPFAFPIFTLPRLDIIKLAIITLL